MRHLEGRILIGLPLTDREQEVVALLCEGHNAESVGHQLNISQWTARRHISTIFGKYGTTTTVELVIQVLTKKHAAELAAVRSTNASQETTRILPH